MAQNPFFKALLQEVLADSEQNLERAILPEHMFGDDGDESESAESLVDDEGAVDEVEDFMVPAQAALGLPLLIFSGSTPTGVDLTNRTIGHSIAAR